jgi:hypothetical protein
LCSVVVADGGGQFNVIEAGVREKGSYDDEAKIRRQLSYGGEAFLLPAVSYPGAPK